MQKTTAVMKILMPTLSNIYVNNEEDTKIMVVSKYYSITNVNYLCFRDKLNIDMNNIYNMQTIYI